MRANVGGIAPQGRILKVRFDISRYPGGFIGLEKRLGVVPQGEVRNRESDATTTLTITGRPVRRTRRSSRLGTNLEPA
jgi:hypothetical protein